MSGLRPRAVVAACAGWLALLSASAPFPAARGEGTGAPPVPPALDISADACRRHVAWLADDAREGREAGEPGAEAAAGYIAERFREAGLAPVEWPAPAGGPRGLLQPFDLVTRRLGPDNRLAVERTSTPAEPAAEFHLEGLDYSVFDFSVRGEADAPIAFAGYGIVAPEHGYDDYAGLDVRGKAVLILRHEPRERPGRGTAFDERWFSAHAHFTAKAKRAEERGAAALLLVTDPLNHALTLPLSAATLYPAPVPGLLREALGGLAGRDLDGLSGRTAAEVVAHAEARGLAGGAGGGLPAFHVSPRVADALLRPAGADLASLQRAIDRALAPASFDVPGVRVRLRADVIATPKPTANVLACLPGRDPVLRGEWIVVGAHYDHIGRGFPGAARPGAPGKDAIFNGADDNASGTAALMEAARALAALPQRPRRTIVFAAFGAEEKGLLGSERFLDALGDAAPRVVAMLNCDMVGRNEPREATVDGARSGPEVEAAVRAAQAAAGLDLEFAAGVTANSDHHPFYRRRVPVAFFFTGFHDDYHRPSDEASRVDAAKVARVARLAAGAAWRLADAAARPAFREIAPDPKDVAQGFRAAGLDVIVFRRVGAAADVLRVTRVRSRGAADRAGVRTGDEITAVQGAAPPAGEAREWLGRTLAAAPPEVVLRVRRGDAERERTLRLDGGEKQD